MAWLRTFAVLLVLLLGIPTVFAAPAPPPTPAPAPLEQIIAQVKPAVVRLSVKGALGGGWSCSGFIYGASGFVLTNHHCVDAAAEITVMLPDRRTFPATVLDYMRRNEYTCPARIEVTIDAAVLKINGANLPTIPMGDVTTVQQGQEIFVLGYPLPSNIPTEEMTVTRGIVSALRPGWLQSDALAAGGNSGGPVIDRQGRVIGLLTFGVGDPRGGGNFSGVTRIDVVRPMAEAALVGGPKTQEFRVTGMEYIPPITVGLRRVFRGTYEPGNTNTQARTADEASEVTQVQNFSGTFAYRVRTGDGTEVQNLLDIDGLQTLGPVGGSWRWTYPEPPVWFRFPPCVGSGWENRYRAENQSAGIVRQIVAQVRITSNNDTVTVPAGSFAQTLRIVTTYQGTDVRGGQQSQWQEVETEWWAPGVGPVRAVTENPATRQRWTTDLVSTGAPQAASPSPPSPPAATPPPTPPQPQPTPPAVPPSPAETAERPGPNDRVIEPGDRVGAVRVGVSLDAVIKVLGEVPAVSRSQITGGTIGWIAYEWKNRLVAEVDKETRIIQRAGVWAPNPQEIAQPPFRVGNIAIGSSIYDVMGAYGRPDSTRENANKTSVQYVYDRVGLGFWIGTSPQYVFNGQVYQIFVFKPGSFGK